MGVAIPQIITEDRASGALVVDGSLRFTGSSYLKRTPGSTGNTTTYTISCWVKRSHLAPDGSGNTNSNSNPIFSAGTNAGSDTDDLQFYKDAGNNNAIRFVAYPGAFRFDLSTSMVFRDVSSWYHILANYDGTTAKIYINGTQVTAFASSTQNGGAGNINTTDQHVIGASCDGSTSVFRGYISQFYFIDGQALDSSYFGYTDPLTNTWRPKKLSSSVAFGTNGFFLPFDGSAPIGQDQSGRGNNWTPVNFGGSNTLEKATGALPILNTDGGGKTAQVEVLGSRAGATFTVTVASAGGGNRYFIDGVQQASLSFIRGATYTFDQSAASNSGHPLLFSTSQDGSTYSDGVTTNGTPGSSGAYTKITVPHNSADTLYYKCGVHSGMGGSISVTTNEKRADLYAWKNVLALPLVGIKSDFSNAINSGSTTKSPVNQDGSATASSAESNFYGGSFYFDGNDTLRYDNLPHIGTGDFTVECWYYKISHNSYERVVSTSISTQADINIGFVLGRDVSGVTNFSCGNVNITGPAISLGRWYHLAGVRKDGVAQFFVNGVSQGITANTTNLTNTDQIYVSGSYISGSEFLTGYISDVRVYNGLAKYTQNFIPASTDPDILPDTPSGVSYSSNLTQITDGAVAFDGSGDWLNVGTSSDYAFGTGDFTMECFVYHNDLTGQQTYFSDAFGNTAGIYFCKREPANGNVLAIYTTTFIVTGSLALSSRRWHHIAVCRSSGTIRLFVDGVLDGSAADSTNLTQTQYSIGESFDGTSGGMNGFISNAHIIKGTALYTSNFTPPTAPISSVANTKLLCCKSNSSATAFDVSPGTITANGNAAATNFNPFTVNINTQRGQESGYATLNPLANPDGTLSNGNLTWSSTTTQDSACASTIYVNSGKWYWEITDITGTGALNVGISKDNDNLSPTPGTTAGGYYYLASAYKYNNNNISVYGSTWTTGDVISAALNMDAGTVTFYKNGVSQGVAYSGLSGYFSPSIGDGGQSTAASGSINFGQKPFKFPPPAGFQPLALANTPRPTIVRPDQFVGVSTYTGTGAARSINTGFKPDFVWIKERGDTGGHVLYDTVRGATKHLATHSTNAEATDTDALTSFNNNGFSLGSGYTVVSVNGSTRTYVAWAWKAGGNSNTYNINDVGYATASAAGLTAGTITPTGASVNTKSGFSIVSFTSDSSTNIFSVAHGLQNTPKFVIVKSRDNGVAPWYVYHSSLATDNYLRLNGTNATASDGANQWGNGMTSSVIGLRAGYTTVASTATIAYCWAEIPGLSKFGTYTGTSGQNFISLGFEPELVIIKNSSSSSYPTYTGWAIFDSERTPYNAVSNALFANKSQVENLRGNGGSVTVADFSLDLLSNGFCLRDNGASEINLSGNTYIYAAWAKAPTQNLYGAQANAR